jgi:hypothetical protein
MYNINKTFTEPYDFLFYYSPSIPYDFPKSRMPKSLCEEFLLSTYKCYLDYEKQGEERLRGEECDRYSSEFNQCKRRRDMQLYHEIEQWETEHFNKLKPEVKNLYLSSLQEELQNLKKNFENTPASEETAEKRWRINADIIQTKWRIGYLKNILGHNKF